MKRLILTMLAPALLATAHQAYPQLDQERSMRNPSLAPRARVSGQDRASETLPYIPQDRQPSGIERQQRKALSEDRNLELNSGLPRYSRGRQQASDRVYRSFRDVEFVRATLERNKTLEPAE